MRTVIRVKQKDPKGYDLVSVGDLFKAISRIPGGGYEYLGAASFQLCFPLKSGGELRFITVDSDCHDEGEDFAFCIDLYDGGLGPVTGPASPTGEREIPSDET